LPFSAPPRLRGEIYATLAEPNASALYVVYLRGEALRGWASVVVLPCMFSRVNLSVLGLVGDYVAKIFESKMRPLH
jgi:hypothetical protein